MNTGKGVIGNKERRKSLWFEGKEEFMEEVLRLALKGQSDSDGKKMEGGGLFRYEEKRK